MAFAVGAVRSRGERAPARSVARAAGGHLILLGLVRWPSPHHFVEDAKRQVQFRGLELRQRPGAEGDKNDSRRKDQDEDTYAPVEELIALEGHLRLPQVYGSEPC
jgi:hypothetical protein